MFGPDEEDGALEGVLAMGMLLVIAERAPARQAAAHAKLLAW